MATEIGTLVARFTSDITHFETGRRRVEAGMRSTQTQTQNFTRALNNALNTVSPQMGQLANSFGAVTSGASVMAGAVGVAALAITAMTAVAIGAAKGIYELATSAAATSDRIGDMADKVNFSVRTLSGLEPAIEAAGGSLEGFSTALGIFDKNIEKVAQGDERLSKLFKGLKIDASDNEVAFRQVADVLVRLEGTSQQTALAMELFGRSGKDVLGAIKAAGGNVETFIKQMEELGIVITEDGVKKADAFDKQMIIVKAQLATVTRQLGEEFMPLVSEAGANLSSWMKDNQGEIRKTIVEIANLIKSIASLAQYIKLVSPIILIVETVHMFSKLLPSGGSAQGITNQQARNVFTVDPVTGKRVYSGNRPYDDPGEFAIAGGAGQRSVGAGPSPGAKEKTEADRLRELINQLLSRKAGGGGGGKKSDPLADMKKLADLQVQITLEALKREEEDVQRSYDQRRTVVEVYHRAITRLEQNRHQTTIDALNAEEKAVKSSKTLTATEKKIQLQELELKRMQEANRHRDEENRLADKILSTTRERVVTMERLVALQTRARRVLEDIGGVTRPRRAEEDIGGVTRPRIATGAEEAVREQYRIHLDNMRRLAYDLTSILDRAIYDGFQGGMKRGFQSLALGILDIVKNVFLKQIEEMLSTSLSGLGGGSFWGRLITGIAGGGFGGLFGGGGGTSFGGAGGALGSLAGSFASGGTIPMGKYGIVHDNERVLATPMGALVIPSQTTNSNSSGNTYNISVNIPESRTADSYKSPRAKRELGDAVAAAIRNAMK